MARIRTLAEAEGRQPAKEAMVERPPDSAYPSSWMELLETYSGVGPNQRALADRCVILVVAMPPRGDDTPPEPPYHQAVLDALLPMVGKDVQITAGKRCRTKTTMEGGGLRVDLAVGCGGVVRPRDVHTGFNTILEALGQTDRLFTQRLVIDRSLTSEYAMTRLGAYLCLPRPPTTMVGPVVQPPARTIPPPDLLSRIFCW